MVIKKHLHYFALNKSFHTMSKVQISATIDENTQKAITEMALSQNRSFSQMVDILLAQSVSKPKKK